MVSLLALTLTFVDSGLLGSSAQNVLRALGPESRAVANTLGADGIRRIRYVAKGGSATAGYVWDRLVSLDREWKGGTPLTVQSALNAARLPLAGMKASGGDRRTVAGTEVQDWSIAWENGSEGTFTIQRTGGKVVQQTLSVQASREAAGWVTVSARKAILDGLRPRVQSDLPGQPIKLLVTSIAQFGPFAFVQGRPVLATGGSAPDYRRTAYRDAFESGAFDEGFSALLGRKGSTWSVLDYAFGATDVPYVDWHERHRSPRFLTLGWAGR